MATCISVCVLALACFLPLSLTACVGDLTDETVGAVRTLTDLQYQFVLDNLAMMSLNPELIPWHAKLDSGSVQTNRNLGGGIGFGTFRLQHGLESADAQALLMPQNQRTLEWDMIPVTNPRELRDLQAAYQKALGYSPEQQLLTQFDVPTGWFGSGKKPDVPPDAAYVGHYRDHYVWVKSDNIKSLSKFTLMILTIVELKPGERTFSRGIISTPAR